MAVYLGKIFSRKNLKRGCFEVNLPRYGVFFQKLPEKIRKKGGRYDLYVHVSRAFNSLPRKLGRALIIIILYICGRASEGNDKIRTHNYLPSPKKRRKEME